MLANASIQINVICVKCSISQDFLAFPPHSPYLGKLLYSSLFDETTHRSQFEETTPMVPYLRKLPIVSYLRKLPFIDFLLSDFVLLM